MESSPWSLVIVLYNSMSDGRKAEYRGEIRGQVSIASELTHRSRLASNGHSQVSDESVLTFVSSIGWAATLPTVECIASG